MRGRRWPLALGCALLLVALWGGSPRGQEMGELALVRTLAVDRAGKGYLVTASTGQRARGDQEDSRGEPLVISAQGDTLTGAMEALERVGEQRLFFGHVDQLLLGQSLGEGGALPLLKEFAGDDRLGLGARVWQVRGSAEELLTSAGEVEPRLEVLARRGEEGRALPPRWAGDVLADLIELGCVWLPALAWEEEDLAPGGCAVLTADGLAGWLSGLGEEGLSLLEGRHRRQLVELPQGAAEVISVRRTISPRWTGEELWGLHMKCVVTARPVEGKELAPSLERELTRRLEAALSALESVQVDCLDLVGRGAVLHPGLAGAEFSSLELEGEVEVKLRQER